MTGERWNQLYARARAVTPPPALTPAALAERFGDRRRWDVLPGQVWRTTTEDSSAVVLVSEVRQGTVTVTPITVDLDRGLPGSAVVSAEHCAFGTPVVVWLSLSTDVAWAALDQLLDDWTGAGVWEWLTQRKRPAPAGCAFQEAPPALLLEPFDEYEQATMSIEELSAAYPPLAEEEGNQERGTPALDGQTPSTLAAALDVPVSTAMQILRGQLSLSAEQASLLLGEAHTEGHPAGQEAQMSTSALAEARHPRWRQDVERLAGQEGLTVSETYTRLTQEAVALAARTTGSESPWSARIQAVLSRDLRHDVG